MRKKRTARAKSEPPYELIPPDFERCQAERPNGYSFMTLGGRPGRVRCSGQPAVIATEVMTDQWGRKGSMSLCAHCFGKMQELRPGVATFEIIVGRGRGGER